MAGPFRRLKWKLTLSYTILTVAAILLLQMAGLVVLRISSLPEPAAERLAGHAAAIAPYLAADPPDRRALRNLLRGDKGGPPGTKPDFAGGRVRAARKSQPARVILDRKGQVVAASSGREDASPAAAWALRTPNSSNQGIRSRPARCWS